MALKILPFDITRDKRQLEDFRNESFLVSQLRHPNILHALDCGETPDCAYIVMRLIGNGTLADRLHGVAWPLKSVYDVIEQVGAALHHAHLQGLVHGDVKPSNILIDNNGTYLLADFGVSRFFIPGHTSQHQQLVGTPSYMSPEQCRGEEGSQQSDIYALGIVLYELLTGRLPFTGSSKEEIMAMQIQMHPSAPRQFNPAVPVKMHRVIETALDKNPGDRFATVLEMVDGVRAAILGAPSETSPAGLNNRAENKLAIAALAPTEAAPPVNPLVPGPLMNQAVYVHDPAIDVFKSVLARVAGTTDEQRSEQAQLLQEIAVEDTKASHRRLGQIHEEQRQHEVRWRLQQRRQQQQERRLIIGTVVVAIVVITALLLFELAST